MAVLNSNILSRAWLQGSNMFQQRIPNPDISDYASTVQAIFDPMNNDLFNEFSGLLNGLIGTYVESKRFENPLRDLKKPLGGQYVYGNSERHVAVKYLQAHSAKFDDETLLKLEKPEFVEWFYSVNQDRRYEFSWNKYDMMRAFAQDGYGFEDLLTATFNQAYSSDNYDEMNVMIQSFAEGDKRLPNGLFRVNLSAAPTDEATAKELLRKIREYSGLFKFPSMLYNHIDVPVFDTRPILWCTPSTKSVLDVEALASIFNLEKAEFQYRIIEIPEFPLPNVYAALTSEDFIFARDVWYGMEPPFYDPSKRSLKYYLFHSQMIGCNPAANCVLFTTEEATNVNTITVEITGLEFSPNAGNVEIGGKLQTHVALTGTGAASKIAIEPDAATYTVAATRADAAIALNTRTYVDGHGVLHVQKTGLAADDVITVTATSVYVNPSGTTTTYTATFTATVIDEAAQGAKECSVETDPYITYTDETEEATASE